MKDHRSQTIRTCQKTLKGRGGKLLKGKKIIAITWVVDFHLLDEHKKTTPRSLGMKRGYCINLSKKWCVFIIEFDVVDVRDQFEINICKWKNIRRIVVLQISHYHATPCL